MRRLLLAGALVLAACSGGSSVDALALVVSSQGSVGTGQQRVLVAVIDQQTSQSLADPDLVPVATLRDGIGSPIGESTGTFVWTVPDVRGLYAFEFDIPGPATYQITIDAGDLGELGPIGLVTVDDPLQVAIGEQAPLSETRTLADAPLEDLTSDPTPDEALYELTVAEAVSTGPSAIVFATPAWCTSQACGPMLDQVQALVPEYPGINFVHVEVYENIHVDDPADLILTPAVSEWGLPSEPWLFVTGGDGSVTAEFEGTVSDEELKAALDDVAG